MSISGAVDFLAFLAIGITLVVGIVYVVLARRKWKNRGYIYAYKAFASLFLCIVLSLEFFTDGNEGLRFILLYTGIILVQSGVLTIGLSEL